MAGEATKLDLASPWLWMRPVGSLLGDGPDMLSSGPETDEPEENDDDEDDDEDENEDADDSRNENEDEAAAAANRDNSNRLQAEEVSLSSDLISHILSGPSSDAVRVRRVAVDLRISVCVCVCVCACVLFAA